MSIRIAGAAIPVSSDVDANVSWIEWAIAEAAAAGADLVVMPEGAVSGYDSEWNPESTRTGVATARAAARRSSLAVALGTFWQDEITGLSCNEIQFIDGSGMVAGRYRKHLLCGTTAAATADPDEELLFTPGDVLDPIEIAGVQIGGLICNDLWANPMYTKVPDPWLARQYHDRGAQVIVHCVNTGIDLRPDARVDRDLGYRFHESNLQLRARAARLPIVTVDCVDPDGLVPSGAPLGAVDADGCWIVRSHRLEPHVFVADVQAQNWSSENCEGSHE